MRHPAIRFVFVLVMALFVGTYAPPAWADARAEAKAHYQAGVKAYGAADYRTAIREFSAAQQLAPADLNNYNLALCYDKLGEAEPAIQYYKEYLAKVPNAPQRVEIEASVARLEGALKSAATKRDEQRKADEARQAEEARKADEARKAAEQARLEEERKAADAKAAEDAKKGATVDAGATGTGAITAGSDPRSVGTSGTPSTGQIISTGDAQLDRAAAIDINAIRQQRAGIGTNAGGQQQQQPAGQGAIGAQGNVGGAAQGQGAQAANLAPRGGDPSMPNAPADQPKKPTPVYKKWWFWAVVAVSAFVVFQIATTDSEPTSRARQGLDFTSARPVQPAPNAGGMTLLTW